LLAHAADAQWGPLATLAQETLESLLENGGSGCALVVSEGAIVPLAAHGLETFGAAGLIELAEWTLQFLRSAEAAARHARVAALLRDDGPSAIAWSDEGIHFAALCADRSDLVNILAHLRRNRSAQDGR
jgi:hypothetical protein